MKSAWSAILAPVSGSRILRISRHIISPALVALAASNAAASPEFIVNYDARSMGMGGTGVSFIDGGSAVFRNEANLDSIDSFSVSAALSPLIIQQNGPLAPDVNLQSDTAVQPLFFLGMGARVSDRVTVGAGVFARSGIGHSFSNVPELGGEDIDLALVAGEVSVPVSVRIADGLSIGVAVRFGFFSQTSQLPQIAPQGPIMVEQDFFGFDPLPGFSLAVHYQPTSRLRLGISYRSRIDIDAEGTVTLTSPTGMVSASGKTTFNVPHALAIGASYAFFGGDLLLSADARILYYEDAFESQTIRLDSTLPDSGGQPTTALVTSFNWQNVIQGGLGAELALAENFAVRLGYGLTNSATPVDTASPIIPPPGFAHMVSLGFGIAVGNFSIDLAGAAILSGYEVEDGEGVAGQHELDAYLASLSATFTL